MKLGNNKKKVSRQGVSRRGFLKSAAIGAAAVIPFHEISDTNNFPSSPSFPSSS